MLKITGILLLMSLVLFSCKKEEEVVTGCTDSFAVNFDPAANQDDGSCLVQYSAFITFWQDFANSQTIDAATFATTIKFYIDGVSVGSMSVDEYQSTEPPCGGGAGYLHHEILGTSLTGTVQYDIRYKNVSDVWVVFQSGTIDLTHGDCVIEQIVF